MAGIKKKKKAHYKQPMELKQITNIQIMYKYPPDVAVLPLTIH